MNFACAIITPHLLSTVDRWKSGAMTIAFGFNQILDSEITIPGAIPVGPSTAHAQSIHIGFGPEHLDATAPLYSVRDDTLLFHAPKVASYRCMPDKIEVCPYPRSDADWISGLLIATAIPAALWMQARFVMHAAAIVPKGASHAIAIAGASGAGKSVLTRQLLEQGASLLADDSVAFEITDAGVIASGLPGGIHHRSGRGDERYFEPVVPDRSVSLAPLGAILLLDGFADSFASAALDKVAACEKIIAHQHRPRIPATLGRIGPVLAQAATIADRIPVSLWRRREGAIMLSEREWEELSALSEHKDIQPLRQ
jgi:hypothetical protein